FLALPPDTRVKGPGRLFQKLLLPGIDLVRVNLIALGQIGHRRLLPHGFQRDLCLQCRVDLPSRLRRHHALRLSNGAAPSNQAHGPKIGVHFTPSLLATRSRDELPRSKARMSVLADDDVVMHQYSERPAISTIARVICTSACEGEGSPDG